MYRLTQERGWARLGVKGRMSERYQDVKGRGVARALLRAAVVRRTP